MMAKYQHVRLWRNCQGLMSFFNLLCLGVFFLFKVQTLITILICYGRGISNFDFTFKTF